MVYIALLMCTMYSLSSYYCQSMFSCFTGQPEGMRSQLHTHSGNRERKLPVFVSPEELQFVGEEEASHKQILTVFNPYDFNIRFKGGFMDVFTAFSNSRMQNHIFSPNSIEAYT